MLKFILKDRYNILDIAVYAALPGLVAAYGWLATIPYILVYAICISFLQTWYETKTS